MKGTINRFSHLLQAVTAIKGNKPGFTLSYTLKVSIYLVEMDR